MITRNLEKEEKWIVYGIIPLFIIGTIMHFLYDLTGEITIIGLISPVNESIWEHTKMVVIPVILWWSTYYFIKGKELKINKDKWFAGGLVALITSIITIPLTYYFYTSAFGVALLWVDISILLIALIFGQLLGLHFYKYSKGINSKVVIIIFLAIIISYMYLTVNPIKIPMFRDGNTGGYGILLFYLF